jgi:hypothetical protein
MQRFGRRSLPLLNLRQAELAIRIIRNFSNKPG